MYTRKFNPNILYYGHEDQFFDQVEIGKIYRYYMGHFLFLDVKKEAEKRGIEIQYLHQQKKVYSYAFKIISIKKELEELKEEKPMLFDVNELVF
jgi:hypothetical protein